jgi:hypothetical protein
MRKVFTAWSLIVLASFMVKAQEESKPLKAPTDGWVKFTSDAGRFSVMLPATPTENIEKGPSSNGPHTTHTFSVKSPSGTIFMIAWVDKDPRSNFNPKRELEASRDKFAQTLQAAILNTRLTTIDGFQALEFTAETQAFDIKSRVFIVGRRPYQIIFASPRGLDTAADLDRFFESFAVRER